MLNFHDGTVLTFPFFLFGMLQLLGNSTWFHFRICCVFFFFFSIVSLLFLLFYSVATISLSFNFSLTKKKNCFVDKKKIGRDIWCAGNMNRNAWDNFKQRLTRWNDAISFLLMILFFFFFFFFKHKLQSPKQNHKQQQWNGRAPILFSNHVSKRVHMFREWPQNSKIFFCCC